MPTCLIVDDSRTIRMVARKIFSDLKFEVMEAENGQLGVESVQRSVPDVVLLDWNMPVMNGLDCLKGIRALAIANQPKVVMCTTENDMNHIMAALEAGASEYIMKPFDSDVIRTKLEQIGVL